MAKRKDCYTDAQKLEIIAHLLGEVAAGRPVSTVLAEDDGMPSRSCFWRWHFEDEELQVQLAAAREHGAGVHLDDSIRISDTPLIGEIVTSEGEKVTIRKEDMLGHRKLQIETRIKAAQMIAPRKYGARLDLTSDGEKIGLSAAMMAAEKRLRDGKD